MNVADHIQNIEDNLDAMASDPDVTSEEYIDACHDLAYRCTAAASYHLAETHGAAQP